LGIDLVFQGVTDKQTIWDGLLTTWSCTARQIACIGDDLPDLPLLRGAGLAIAVADAVPEIRSAAHYITRLPGGRGAVREVIEWLLRNQGLWDAIVSRWDPFERRQGHSP
jgi:3-deoxy-D-manno-octulosonate 8-phosphate phosphatase (KDO 8-P phosphatase)